MQGDYQAQDENHPTFGAFLRAYRLKILLVLLLALAVRVGFVVIFPDPLQDTRYLPTAINILEGHGFSVDAHAPYRPSEAAAPAYPLYIATIYALFGRSVFTLVLSQAFLDLFTCLLVAFTSFSLAPTRLKNLAAILSLSLYGIFAWPASVWVSRVYAETLTLFLTMLMVVLCIWALHRGVRYWLAAGLVCGLAILTRPDSILLLGAAVLFLLFRFARQPSRVGAINFISFCFAVALVLAPWAVRNYVSLGKFQPLASEYGSPREGYFPTGYLWWIRTWLKDETYFDYAFDPAWHPENTFFDPDKLPAEAYDSEEERRHLANLIARYNQSRFITPGLDEDFRSLAKERIARNPLRFFVLLPLYRVASMWLTGFSTSHATPYMLVLRILSVLPLHLGGIIALALLCRRRTLSVLLVLIILVRTLFMAYHYAPETRYVAEIYPPMMAACGVTVAALWSYVAAYFPLRMQGSATGGNKPV